MIDSGKPYVAYAQAHVVRTTALNTGPVKLMMHLLSGLLDSSDFFLFFFFFCKLVFTHVISSFF